jgi:hypothetical protein
MLQLEAHPAGNRGKTAGAGGGWGLQTRRLTNGKKLHKSLTSRGVLATVGQAVLQKSKKHKHNPTLTEP